jgi:hypothetical protein
MAYMLPSLGRIDEAKAHVATLLKMKPGFTIREANAYQTIGVMSRPISRK